MLWEKVLFWKNVIDVGMTQPWVGGEVGGPPYSLNTPLAPQAGQAVVLQCGTSAGLKSMMLPVTKTFAVFHKHPFQ